MQTACCWQLCFSDRFTGARNPARLPTTIQSRRIRYAPTMVQRLAGTTLSFYHPRPFREVYNRNMRHLGRSLQTLLVSAVLAAALAVSAVAAPMTKITIVVK